MGTEEIYLPTDITIKSVDEFLRRLDKINVYNNQEIIINIRHFANGNGRIEPIAALKLINELKRFNFFFKENNNQRGLRIFCPKQIVNTYAKTMRFYGALGLSHGSKPTEDFQYNATKKYLPILEIDLKEVITEALHVNDEVDKLSLQMAKILANGDSTLRKYLDYSLNELIRNVLQHSGTSKMWCAAQVWPTEKGGRCIELALMDQGKGIDSSLEENYNNMFSKPLRYAIIPGCSSKVTTFTSESAENSGVGLFMTSEITRENGEFYIFSNKNSIELKGNDITEGSCNLEGTLIGIRLNIDSLSDYEVKISELIDKGNLLQKKFQKYVERSRFAPGLEQKEFYETI